MTDPDGCRWKSDPRCQWQSHSRDKRISSRCWQSLQHLEQPQQDGSGQHSHTQLREVVVTQRQHSQKTALPSSHVWLLLQGSSLGQSLIFNPLCLSVLSTAPLLESFLTPWNAAPRDLIVPVLHSLVIPLSTLQQFPARARRQPVVCNSSPCRVFEWVVLIMI